MRRTKYSAWEDIKTTEELEAEAAETARIEPLPGRSPPCPMFTGELALHPAILVLAGTAGRGMALPASTRISARLKAVQEHSSPPPRPALPSPALPYRKSVARTTSGDGTHR